MSNIKMQGLVLYGELSVIFCENHTRHLEIVCVCVCVYVCEGGDVKVKLKFSRYRPGVAQRLGRGIALLFHDRGTRRG